MTIFILILILVVNGFVLCIISYIYLIFHLFFSSTSNTSLDSSQSNIIKEQNFDDANKKKKKRNRRKKSTGGISSKVESPENDDTDSEDEDILAHFVSNDPKPSTQSNSIVSKQLVSEYEGNHFGKKISYLLLLLFLIDIHGF